jgi:hypothetical protein
VTDLAARAGGFRGVVPPGLHRATRGAEGVSVTDLAARAGGSGGSSPRACTAPPEERRAYQ